jgi:hypothetical protein
MGVDKVVLAPPPPPIFGYMLGHIEKLEKEGGFFKSMKSPKRDGVTK